MNRGAMDEPGQVVTTEPAAAAQAAVVLAHRFSSRIGSRVSDESAYCGGELAMGVVEIAPRTWRIESLIGLRNLFQYLIAGEEAALILDTGTSVTPRDEILPALRHLDLPAG